jgi:hypothetical protein
MMDLPPVTDPYQGLLRSKFKFSRFDGFEIADRDIRPRLKPHQRDIVRWAVRKGRVGIFASFGLGKTNMQLEILRAIGDREGGRQLMVIPLGVRGGGRSFGAGPVFRPGKHRMTIAPVHFLKGSRPK